MKTSVILALPFLLLASAAPAKLDERQPVELSEIKPDVKCAVDVAIDIQGCFPNIKEGDKVGLEELSTCLGKFSETLGRVSRLETVPCVF